jgi:hypothetical protein
MPFKVGQYGGAPISFTGRNSARVWVGPNSVSPFSKKKIPLDGRKYELGGEIILKNGIYLSASFRIDTSRFNFLVKDSVWVLVDDYWYHLDEPELLEKFKITSDEAFPFKWVPDIPLDYYKKSPYDADPYDPLV